MLAPLISCAALSALLPPHRPPPYNAVEPSPPRLARSSQALCLFPLQDGFTPLHFAAAMGHVRVVRQLLISGAKIDASTNRVRRMHRI